MIECEMDGVYERLHYFASIVPFPEVESGLVGFGDQSISDAYAEVLELKRRKQMLSAEIAELDRRLQSFNGCDIGDRVFHLEEITLGYGTDNKQEWHIIKEFNIDLDEMREYVVSGYLNTNNYRNILITSQVKRPNIQAFGTRDHRCIPTAVQMGRRVVYLCRGLWA